MKSAPGISETPASRPLSARLKFRFAKKPTNHAGRAYRAVKSIQVPIKQKQTAPAAIARSGGAHAPHHGVSSGRLKGILHPLGYAIRTKPKRENTLQSDLPNSN